MSNACSTRKCMVEMAIQHTCRAKPIAVLVLRPHLSTQPPHDLTKLFHHTCPKDQRMHWLSGFKFQWAFNSKSGIVAALGGLDQLKWHKLYLV